MVGLVVHMNFGIAVEMAVGIVVGAHMNCAGFHVRNAFHGHLFRVRVRILDFHNFAGMALGNFVAGEEHN